MNRESLNMSLEGFSSNIFRDSLQPHVFRGRSEVAKFSCLGTFIKNLCRKCVISAQYQKFTWYVRKQLVLKSFLTQQFT